MITTCSIEGCKNTGKLRRGWCATHYSRWRKSGDPLYVTVVNYSSPQEALQARSRRDPETGCVTWVGSLNQKGYGKIYTPDGVRYVHRFAWEQVNGEIASGMELDHRCHNRACVNIDHLRLATHKQNLENLKGARPESRSGIRGVTWNKQKQKYCAQVCHKGKRYYGGFFADPVKAGKVAAAMRFELFTHH